MFLLTIHVFSQTSTKAFQNEEFAILKPLIDSVKILYENEEFSKTLSLCDSLNTLGYSNYFLDKVILGCYQSMSEKEPVGISRYSELLNNSYRIYGRKFMNENLETRLYKIAHSPPKPINELEEMKRRYLEYPQSEYKNKIEGKVFLQFVVNNNGSVDAIKVMKGITPNLDKEAIRILNHMRWTPAKVDGNSVYFMHHLIIDFNIKKFKKYRR